MNRPLSIIHALHKNRLSTGSVVQMAEAALVQRRRGHDVVVASRPGGDLEQLCRDGNLRWLPLPLRHHLDLGSILALRREMVRGADIVHVHKGLDHWLALAAAAGLGPRPRMVVNRGVSFPLTLSNRWKYRHPRVASVVCVAEAVREVVARTGHVDESRLTVIHGGTDTDRFDPRTADPRAIRSELGLPPDGLVISTASARSWKGWRELLQAYVDLTQTNPELWLLAVGCESQAEIERVREAASSSPARDRVVALGIREDMPDILAASDIVVDASWDGTGITGTIREAMAMGRAVIASDVAGNAELVNSSRVGRLVPPRDIDALKTRLQELISSRQLRESLGRSARDRVIADFSTESRVERLIELYYQVVRDNRARPGRSPENNEGA